MTARKLGYSSAKSGSKWITNYDVVIGKYVMVTQDIAASVVLMGKRSKMRVEKCSCDSKLGG